jgi:hypothetical protein
MRYFGSNLRLTGTDEDKERKVEEERKGKMVDLAKTRLIS